MWAILNMGYSTKRQSNWETRVRTVETDPPVEETISLSRAQMQNSDAGNSHQEQASAVILSAEHSQAELSEPSST